MFTRVKSGVLTQVIDTLQPATTQNIEQGTDQAPAQGPDKGPDTARPNLWELQVWPNNKEEYTSVFGEVPAEGKRLSAAEIKVANAKIKAMDTSMTLIKEGEDRWLLPFNPAQSGVVYKEDNKVRSL